MEQATWERHKRDFETRIRDIVIPPDINPGTAKPLVAKLDSLYTDVMLLYPDIKVSDDNITQLLDNTKKLAAATGSNPDARTARAITAAQEYGDDDVKINLFDIKQVTNERLIFINSIVKIIEGKQNRLITALGLMKIESNF